MKKPLKNFEPNVPELSVALLSKKIDYDLEAHIAESNMAAALMEPLTRYNTISASILIGFALGYADPRKPTIAALYRRYQAEIAHYNKAHSRGEPVPVLSKNVFEASVERLDPAFVLVSRYCSHGGSKYYLRRLHRDFRRAAKARIAHI